MDKNAKQIINAFSSWRMSQGISYRAAGLLIGINAGHLCSIESGKRGASPAVVANMERHMNNVRRAKELWGDSLTPT